jgi:hypothetical protein
MGPKRAYHKPKETSDLHLSGGLRGTTAVNEALKTQFCKAIGRPGRQSQWSKSGLVKVFYSLQQLKLRIELEREGL